MTASQKMAKRVFSAAFAWSVIEKKSPGFETAFSASSQEVSRFSPMSFRDRLLSHKRILHDGAKIMAVRTNAPFVAEIEREMAPSASFWPSGRRVIRRGSLICSPNAVRVLLGRCCCAF